MLSRVEEREHVPIVVKLTMANGETVATHVMNCAPYGIPLFVPATDHFSPEDCISALLSGFAVARVTLWDTSFNRPHMSRNSFHIKGIHCRDDQVLHEKSRELVRGGRGVSRSDSFDKAPAGEQYQYYGKLRTRGRQLLAQLCSV